MLDLILAGADVWYELDEFSFGHGTCTGQGSGFVISRDLRWSGPRPGNGSGDDCNVPGNGSGTGTGGGYGNITGFGYGQGDGYGAGTKKTLLHWA